MPNYAILLTIRVSSRYQKQKETGSISLVEIFIKMDTVNKEKTAPTCTTKLFCWKKENQWILSLMSLTSSFSTGSIKSLTLRELNL